MTGHTSCWLTAQIERQNKSPHFFTLDGGIERGGDGWCWIFWTQFGKKQIKRWRKEEGTLKRNERKEDEIWNKLTLEAPNIIYNVF